MAKILGSLDLKKSVLEQPFDEKIIGKFNSQIASAMDEDRPRSLPGMFRGLVSAARAPNQRPPLTELYNPGGHYTYGALMICLHELGNMDSSQGTKFGPDFASPTVLRMLSQLNLEEILYKHLSDYKERTSLLRMKERWGAYESTDAPTPLYKIQSILRSAVAESILRSAVTESAAESATGAESKSVGPAEHPDQNHPA